LSWGAQNWTQYSRWGLTRAEWRGWSSLDLLATLLTPLNTSQDTTGLLGNKGTLHKVVHQYSQVSLCRAALQQVCPEPLPVHLEKQS